MPERLIALVAIVSGLALAAGLLLVHHASALTTGLGLAAGFAASFGVVVLVRAVIVLERREARR